MSEPKPAYDPTAVLVSTPKVPMTPAQLDALRPKPVLVHEDGSAKAIAYRAGVKELENIVLRLEALEAEVRRLKHQ